MAVIECGRRDIDQYEGKMETDMYTVSALTHLSQSVFIKFALI